MLRACGVISVLVMIASCAGSASHLPPRSATYEVIYGGKQPFPIEYGYVDTPAKRQIELTYTNKLNLAVCLYPEYWPSSTVPIDSFTAPVVLVIHGKRFPLAFGNPEYCPGCCLLVEPGETVHAFISYDGFHFPATLENEQKELEYKPMGWYCRLRQ